MFRRCQPFRSAPTRTHYLRRVRVLEALRADLGAEPVAKTSRLIRRVSFNLVQLAELVYGRVVQVEFDCPSVALPPIGFFW